MSQWKPHRDQYLREFVRLDGRGDAAEECTSCIDRKAAKTGVIRCRDCFGEGLVCADCCVRTHAENPLHAIEVRLTSLFF